MMTELIWQEHGEELLDLMQESDRENGHEPITTRSADNLELPFDDPLPF